MVQARVNRVHALMKWTVLSLLNARLEKQTWMSYICHCNYYHSSGMVEKFTAVKQQLQLHYSYCQRGVPPDSILALPEKGRNIKFLCKEWFKSCDRHTHVYGDISLLKEKLRVRHKEIRGLSKWDSNQSQKWVTDFLSLRTLGHSLNNKKHQVSSIK